MNKILFEANILTIFPQMFPGSLAYSLAGKALNTIWKYELFDIRKFGLTRHKNVDDEPYGGGSGMIMRPDVIGATLDHVIDNKGKQPIIYMSPRGEKLTQKIINDISKLPSIIILCGRFEGVDERLIEEYEVIEYSIGDYIISGGEQAALTMLDACIRLLPGVINNPNTLNEESFNIYNDNKDMLLLEYPLYTRPHNWRDRCVPEVLLSGNHQAIKEWRMDKALALTKKRNG